MSNLLKQLSDKVWVIQGRTNTGIIKLSEDLCLIIDPGQDKESAKTVLESLSVLNLELAGVFITHAHADHYGGAQFLKSNLKVEYFASEFESSLIEQPLLEPIFLFGGAEPIPELTHKFILAKPLTISQRLQEGVWEFKGVKFGVINLAGHSTGQIGLAYENLLFGGDALTLRKYIEKYKFPFFSDIQKSYMTFDNILKSNYDLFVPGHGEVLDEENYRREALYNLEYLQKLIQVVKQCLSEGPLTEAELLRNVAVSLETPLVTVVQFVLNRTIVLAILKYLQVINEVCSYFEDNRWLWRLQ
jgi:glyoxylase-like metal-dependent hydrolase (beta-lactamase superfamily II)